MRHETLPARLPHGEVVIEEGDCNLNRFGMAACPCAERRFRHLLVRERLAAVWRGGTKPLAQDHIAIELAVLAHLCGRLAGGSGGDQAPQAARTVVAEHLLPGLITSPTPWGTTRDAPRTARQRPCSPDYFAPNSEHVDI
ncbi:MAG: hypothetical protein ACRDT8_25640 [Micromonosporaceae bacterium]